MTCTAQNPLYLTLKLVVGKVLYQTPPTKVCVVIKHQDFSEGACEVRAQRRRWMFLNVETIESAMLCFVHLPFAAGGFRVVGWPKVFADRPGRAQSVQIRAPSWGRNPKDFGPKSVPAQTYTDFSRPGRSGRTFDQPPLPRDAFRGTFRKVLCVWPAHGLSKP